MQVRRDLRLNPFTDQQLPAVIHRWIERRADPNFLSGR